VRASEIPYLEVAVLIQQDVTRLKVSVYDPSRVDVLEGSEDLIEEVLDMLYLQFLLGLDHSVQVGLHQLRYQIYVA
jgi:hypothetical protein